MKYLRLLGLLLFCVFITSCQQNVSGTYKSIKTSDSSESDEISIDWEGKTFERSLYGHANEVNQGDRSLIQVWIKDLSP